MSVPCDRSERIGIEGGIGVVELIAERHDHLIENGELRIAPAVGAARCKNTSDVELQRS